MLRLHERKNRLNRSYVSKVIKVLRLNTLFENQTLGQGPICNYKKLNRDLKLKV
jgi:hypothetical protein